MWITLLASSFAAEPRVFEGEASFGVLTTVLSPEHELYAQQNLHERISPTFGAAARFGVYPLAVLGFEADAALGTGVTSYSKGAALVDGLAVSVVGGPWIGDPRAHRQPFVSVGTGLLGQSSNVLGTDSDAAFHVGAGAKYKFGDRAKVRVDLRDTLSSRFGAAGAPTHNVSFGVSYALRIGPPPPPTTEELVIELLNAYEDPLTPDDLAKLAPPDELEAALLKVANDPDVPPSRRGRAVSGLAMIPPTPEAQAELEQLFLTPDPLLGGYLQRKAVWSLAQAYPEAGKQAIEKALENPDLQVQWAAIHFLEEKARTDPEADAKIEADVPHVTFTMTGPDGRPIEGALVQVTGPQGSSFAYDGADRARVIDPRFSGKEPWTVAAEFGECLRARQEVVTGKEAAKIEIVMEAFRENPVAFELRDDAGQLLQNAKVTFLSGPDYCSPEGTVEIAAGTPVNVGPGTFEVRVEADGYAPQVQTVVVEKGKLVSVATTLPRSAVKVEADRLRTETIKFDSGQATIAAQSFQMLDDLAQVIISGQFNPVRVEGHTDNQGNPEQNLQLSQRRAEAVRAYLVRKGVPAEWIVAEGFGDTRPLVPNDTAEGQRTNRRVDFVIGAAATAPTPPAPTPANP